jgi:hypothetical protein
MCLDVVSFMIGNYPHPIIYTLLHQIKFSFLPAPYRYTPTHAPGYWIDTLSRTKNTKITRLYPPFPYELERASVNSMRGIECLMVGPGALVIKTPEFDACSSLFHRIDAERLFTTYTPGELVLVTGVKPWELIWEPVKRMPSLLWPLATDTVMPGLCLTSTAGSTWNGPEVGLFDIDMSLPNSPNTQSTTSGPSAPSQERHSTATPRPTAWAF